MPRPKPGYRRYDFKRRSAGCRDKRKSGLYLESATAERIYTATVSPTYHIRDNAYIRADLGYVRAAGGITDGNGRPRSDRIASAIEMGFTF
jgi:hypothetical protein